MGRLRIGAGLGAALAVCLVLVSCTAVEPKIEATPSPSVTADIPSPTPTGEAGSGLEAIIVVAGIDTDGAHVSASGYVSGVIEEGGTCSFEFSNGIDTVLADTDGITDARSTSCGTVQVPAESFVRGSWTVTLSYASETAEAVSEPVGLEIP